jgi:hypothetical protein
VLNVTFDESLMNNKIGNAQVSLSNTHLLAYNVYDTLDVILPQRIFERATLVWVGGGCLYAWPPIGNPLVDGTGDAMFCAIHDFFIIGHLPGANVNEWVEFIAAEADSEWLSDGHVRLLG